MCPVVIGQCVQYSLDNVSNIHVRVWQDFLALSIKHPIFFHLDLILSNQMWFVRHRRCQRCQLSGALDVSPGASGPYMFINIMSSFIRKWCQINMCVLGFLGEGRQGMGGVVNRHWTAIWRGKNHFKDERDGLGVAHVVFHELRHYVTNNEWLIVSSISFLFHVSNSPLDTLIPVLTMLQWISILINFSRTLAIFCRQGAADYVREEWVMFFKLLHITLSFFWWSEVVYLSLLLCIVTMQRCWSRLNCCYHTCSNLGSKW